MVQKWTDLHFAPDVVVDVGAGVGAFTTAASTAWPNSQVWSIDINPVTLGLLALRVHSGFELRPAGGRGPGIRVILDDFTVWMKDEWAQRAGRRLVLGNPPYTRMHLLPRDQRERLLEAADGLCSARASLSAIITAQALKALGPDDGLCILLPAQWLESDYARALRSFIWSMKRRRVDLRLFNDTPFTDAAVDAVALIVGPEEAQPQPMAFTAGQVERVIPNREAHQPDEWRSLFGPVVIARRPPSEPPPLLGDLLAVHRGVATGDNSYFVLTEDQVSELGLPAAGLTPLVRRLNGLPDAITVETIGSVAEQRFHLLTLSAAQAQTSEAAKAYVARGEERGVAGRYLCRTRPCWHDLSPEVSTPDLLIGQSTKGDFRIVENRASATIVNNVYGMTWRDGLADELTRRDLVAWIRSSAGQTALKGAARTHATGLLKLEPKALSRLPIPERFRLPGETLV
jgi:tRNA1(Val) A37 N6-methylase TrmN6